VPTDVGLIVANLSAFYDWSGKTVVHVGAGGGQLLGYAARCRRVVAVDRDAAAVARLREKLRGHALEPIFEVVVGDFDSLRLQGDVVLLEFCLHEMTDPAAAIRHARAAAPDVVVIDHRPESPWSWYAAEADAMERAWTAVAAAGTRQERGYDAVQRFDHFRDLEARFATLGDESQRRIGVFRDQGDIEIPMPYGIALL
jgi:ubiquinone/menaquinone biosynthesis C-methylase UbiE